MDSDQIDIGNLISAVQISNIMDIQESIVDIILAIVLIISTLVLILRVWQDLILAVAATLMMASLGGLFLSLGAKIRNLDQNVIARERTMRMNLDELNLMVCNKCDTMISEVHQIVSELSRRVYR
ncbi:hypothetical protein MKMG_01444 [Methanogenium sp. MK-MG]|nr:hypothetical protein MKMG_01444 [Methanogenium sp. MK-MG]